MKFSLIIPTYNEKESIIYIINKLIAISWEEFPEIIVVDDGSKEKVSNLRELNIKKIKIFRHEKNRGYGAALKTGIRNSKYDNIAIIDADGTYPNDKIGEIVKVFEDGNYDMVVGARTGENVHIPLIRKPAKWFLNKLACYLTETKIPDLNSGLRIMKKDVVNRFLHLLPASFSFTSTITLAMLTSGYSVKYIPIDYFKRKGKSKIKPIRDTLNFIQLIIRTILYFNPLKVFIPLSFFLVIFAFIVLIVSWLLIGRPMDMSFGVIIMTAVIVLAIGMLADLIIKRIH